MKMQQTEDMDALKARVAELERYSGVLYEKLTERTESLQELIPKFFRDDEIPSFDGENEKPVDLVLTVKNTFDFIVPCLESVFQNTDVPFRLFLNDNASDDPRTPKYLREIADRHPDRVTLFLQKKDLGFTDAANMLLEKTVNDVVLINADTALPPNWASRLLWPIRQSGLKVASSAPFTNAAAFAAFPDSARVNDLLPGMDVAAMDGIFRHAKPSTEWRFPFSPGFCMAISRAALDEIGLFDAETFRPGYGEEGDWCFRASERGYLHLLATNVFVYHKQSATTKDLPAFRAEMLRRHEAIIFQRYPFFIDRLCDFKDDPCFRAYSSFLLFLAGTGSGGGLSVRFVPYEALRQDAADAASPTLLAARHPDTGEYFLRFLYREYRASFSSPTLNWVIKALYRVAVRSATVECYPPGDEAGTRRALVRMGKHFGMTPRERNGDEIHEA